MMATPSQTLLRWRTALPLGLVGQRLSHTGDTGVRLRTEGMDWRGILSPGLGLGLCPVPGKDKTGAGRRVGGHISQLLLLL